MFMQTFCERDQKQTAGKWQCLWSWCLRNDMKTTGENVGCCDILWCPTVRFVEVVGNDWLAASFAVWFAFCSLMMCFSPPVSFEMSWQFWCGFIRSKVICLCVFFVVIEWWAVGIWKAFTSRLKFAKWSDCLDEHPLHTGRCSEYQYQVWNGGKQHHHVSPPNHELQADIWTNTVYFISY